MAAQGRRNGTKLLTDAMGFTATGNRPNSRGATTLSCGGAAGAVGRRWTVGSHPPARADHQRLAPKESRYPAQCWLTAPRRQTPLRPRKSTQLSVGAYKNRWVTGGYGRWGIRGHDPANECLRGACTRNAQCPPLAGAAPGTGVISTAKIGLVEYTVYVHCGRCTPARHPCLSCSAPREPKKRKLC